MFFVINKNEFQRTISIVRDDRRKPRQGKSGPFMRIEAQDSHVIIGGLEASAKIPATVYEPGVLFLKITVFRRLLQTIKGETYVAIQVTTDELLLDSIRLPLESNEMMLFVDPKLALQKHPSVSISEVAARTHPHATRKDRQLLLWDDLELE